ncbi:protein wntless homolog [Lineus longissimus]|uniref:protein wntless homolog n=1 Tax=Lineus longissimus TaxID=88925 RepID=UPI002B4D94E8
MGGVVLETLSGKKLIALTVVLLILQLVCFLIGGLVAPSPNNAQVVLGTMCLDKGNHAHKQKWFYPRVSDPKKYTTCDRVKSLSDPKIEEMKIEAKDVVFAFQIPLPKEGKKLDMSRWFQNLISVLQVDVEYDEKNKLSDNPVMVLDAKLAYQNIGDKEDDWKLIAESSETRRMECDIDPDKMKNGHQYNCSMLPFFELGSCHHDYYLINIRIPVNEKKGINMGLGKIVDMWLITIHQNGGFTKVWFSLKTFMFPCLLGILAWFWRRITQMVRPPNLLERTLFALGLALSFLNLPLEWLTLAVNMPFMMLLGDIRQGIFYSTLLCFWIIFAGEHMMDQVERNRVVLYWKHLSAVAFGCICLFVFEMCERGVQLTNPFFSIWVTEVGTNLALAFIILAGIAACLYFLFLSYMIFRVFRNISAKKSALPAMSKARKKYYMGLIYRFKILMLATLLCAALTVIFFIISQVSESVWKWGDENSLEYTSAFLTGVYGMWNLYVFALLCLYAPSHKMMSSDITGDNSETNEEEVEFTRIPTEQSAITSMAQKAAVE